MAAPIIGLPDRSDPKPARRLTLAAAFLLSAQFAIAPYLPLVTTTDVRPVAVSLDRLPLTRMAQYGSVTLDMPLCEAFRIAGNPHAAEGNWDPGEETVGGYFESCYGFAVEEARRNWGWRVRDEAIGLAICLVNFGAYPPINHENTPGIWMMRMMWDEAAERRRSWQEDPRYWLCAAPILGTPVHRDSTVGGMTPYFDYLSADLTTGGLPTTSDGSQWCEGSVQNRWRVGGTVPTTRESMTDPIDGATTVYMDADQRGFSTCCRCVDVATHVPEQRYANRSWLRSAWKAGSNVVVSADTRTTRYVRADGNITASGENDTTDILTGAKQTVAQAEALIGANDNWKIVVNGTAGAVAHGASFSYVRRGILVTGINNAIVTTADATAFQFGTNGSQCVFQNLAYQPASGTTSNYFLANAAVNSSAKCFTVYNCTALDNGAAHVKYFVISENGAGGAICDGLGIISSTVGPLAETVAYGHYSENPKHLCFWNYTVNDIGTQGHGARLANTDTSATATGCSYNFCTVDNSTGFTSFGGVCPYLTAYSVNCLSGNLANGDPGGDQEDVAQNRFERCRISDGVYSFTMFQRPGEVAYFGIYIERTLRVDNITGGANVGVFVRGCVVTSGSDFCVQVDDDATTDATGVKIQSNILKTTGVPLIMPSNASLANGYAFDGNCFTSGLAEYNYIGGTGQDQTAYLANNFVGVNKAEVFETQASFNATTLEPSGTNSKTAGYPAVMGGGTLFNWNGFNVAATTCPAGGWSGAALSAPTIGTVTPGDGELSVAYTASNAIRAHSGDAEGESDTVTADAATPVSLSGTNGALLYFTLFEVTTTGAMSPESAQGSGTPEASGGSVTVPTAARGGRPTGRGFGLRGRRSS